MATKHAIHFGPRLIGTPTGTLRAAVLVRPAPSLESARRMPGEPAAVYARALEQHTILRKTLEYFGVEAIVFEPRGSDPYECAAADAAVAFEDGAMIARPVAMARRAEADRMQAEFAQIDAPIAGHIEPPGLLDGTDVLLAGNTAFIGVGPAGNDLGRAGFAAVARAHGYKTVEVALAPDVRSLRSVASAVSKDTIVVSGGKADVSKFSGFNVVEFDLGEDLAGGVLCLGERHVIADVRYRTAFRIMRKAGIVVEGLDLYDFEKVGITPSMLVLALKRD